MICIKRPPSFDLLPLSIFLAVAFISGVLCGGRAMAADDVTARAMKLYEKHYYEEAAHLLRAEMSGMDSARQASASLVLGMAYLGSAKLCRELQQTATVIELDYLTMLSRQKNGAASRYVDLYMGQALVEAGKAAEGATYLKRFSGRATEQSAKSHAQIELGIAYSRQKQAQKAAQAWSKMNMSKPEIRAAMAGAYAVAGMQEQKPVSMADAAMHDAKVQGYNPSMRMVRNLLRAYTNGGAPEKALELLDKSQLKDASHVEDLGASKTISFYDLSLLDDLARIHLGAAVMYLEQAKRDAKSSDTATYFLADAYLQQGNTELSLRATAALLSQPKIPAKYRDIAQVIQASAHNKAGRRAEASAMWQALAVKAADEPTLLAEVVLACAHARADCVKIEKQALAAVDKGEGKKYFPLNAALGKYYLLQKDYSRAVVYMEAGRDKAYKNKIEVNDPVMLAGLAEAYYRNKKFSENLEIYFEIGKQYPVVRQIQEAMQGIYAMEQQSAGDVKIF
jgi:tetratricopeptide (TPR) repeat protein